MVLKDCDFLNQAADQRFVKLCDGGRLVLNEILQVPDLLHLFIFDDAVHCGLPELLPEVKRLIRNDIVVRKIKICLKMRSMLSCCHQEPGNHSEKVFDD